MGIVRRLSRAVALGASLLLATSALTAPAQAASGPSAFVEGTDAQAWLYDPLNINRIDLTIPQDSLLALSQDSFQNQVSYEPADMVFSSYKGTLPSMNVGVHLKGGLGSRKPIASCASGNGCSVLTNSKPALKIKMDFGAANSKQRLYGLKEITLNSMVQDPSMIHETVDYRIARAAGLPAPRTGFVHVYANGVDLGLHLLVEQYDSSLFDRWFAAGTQSEYEGAYWQDIVSTGNAVVQPYTSLQKHMGDPADSSDLGAVASTQSLSGSAWWNSMNQLTDVGELTQDWAFEHFVQQWDAYSWFIINNYQVHFDGAGVMTMHPWGMDQTLINNAGDYNVHFLSTVTDVSGRATGTLFTKCLQYSVCKQLYISELAKIGATADSLNMGPFIDQVWGAIGPDVLADPVMPGANAQRYELAAKSFVLNRTKNVDYLAAITTRKIANLKLTYPNQTVFTLNKTLAPTVTNDTGVAPTFRLMGQQADPVCSMDSTGVLTALKPGYCEVSISTPQGSLVAQGGQPGYHYGYATAVVNVGKIPGTVSINSISALRYQTPQVIEVTTNSTGAQNITTKGACTYDGQSLIATAATGVCAVTISVAKDASHSKVSVTQNIPLAKAIEPTTLYSTDGDWNAMDGNRLPKGATLKLVTKPSKVLGSCSFSGALLKAIGSAGYCKVVLPVWETSTVRHLGGTFVIGLAPTQQAFVQKVAPAVTRKKLGTRKLVLSDNFVVTTTSNIAAFWSLEGNCEWVSEGVKAVIHMNGSGTCKVDLSANPGYKTKGLNRVWTFIK